ELVVVLPHAAVGGVDGSGPVVVGQVADHGGNRALQLEGGQGRYFGQQVVVGRALAADGGDRQDQVADPVFLLHPATLAQKQHRCWMDRGQQVHHRGGIGTAHAEVDHADAVGGGVGHGMVQPPHLHAVFPGEEVHVVVKIGQQ